MKKLLSRTTLSLIALTIMGFAVMPEWVHAAGWLEGPITSVVNNLFAIIMNKVLELTSWFVWICGILLSLSLNITLHVGELFKGAPALKGVWILIRNLSSIGIIFILLYTSILTIVGVSSSGDIKKIVGKIIMAGLLINFSLFFVNIAIDASNLVSLQFYRAIAPESTNAYTVGDALTDGGLSNVFMSSLKIPRIYQAKDKLSGTDVFASITIATLGGVMMMVTAAISFAAASVALLYRTVVLLFVMAFSPVYFVAMIFPQLEDKSKELVKIFTSQLLFMPTYLFLLYVSLRFVGDDSFSKIFNTTAGGATGPGTPAFLSTMIQYVIALLFINAPLLAAYAAVSEATKMVPSLKTVSSFVGRHVIGRGANKFDKALENNPRLGKIANWNISRELRGATTQKLASSKFGGSSSFKDSEKESKEKKKKDRELDRLAELRAGIDHARTTAALNPLVGADTKKIKDALGKMSTSEIAALDRKMLTDEHVIPLLSSSVFTAIDKSEKKDGDKVAISTARTEALKKAVSSHATAPAPSAEKIKNIMKNMDGEELGEYIESVGTPVNPLIIAEIRANQLKDMDGMREPLRREIGNAIINWVAPAGAPPTNHQAWDHVDKNRSAWGVPPRP